MGDSRVGIEADGYGGLELPIHLVGTLKRDFELVPEGALAGHVVDERGASVPFARVVALPQAVEQPHFLALGSTTADGDGHFRVPNLAPGRFLLVAFAPGHGTAPPTPAVAALGSTEEVTVVLIARAQVTGTVMMKGKPVEGARVSVATPGYVGRTGYSQLDGSFVIEGVPLGANKLVAGPFEVITPKQLVVDKLALDGVVIEVAEMATLTGRVLRQGKPVADATVLTQQGSQTVSDAMGSYKLTGLPPGDLQVMAQVFGTVNAFAPFTPVKIALGAPNKHDIELTGAAEVHGVVVDESRKPVPNVYVRLIDPKGDIGESMTDANGAFTCMSMTGGGDYRAAVFPSPGARTAFPPGSGDRYPAFAIRDGDTVLRDVVIAIKHETLAIAGRVVDDTGAPVADVHVEAIGAGFGGNPSMLPSVRADVDGAFVIRDLARGPYTLHAHAGDGSEVELADIAAGTANVKLQLIRPGSIEGKIVGFKSTPRVHARQLTANLAVGNEAVVQGDRFTITGLTPGKYVLEALAGDENDGESVIVKSGAVTTVTLESRGKGTVEGTLTEFGGTTPIKGMKCNAAQSMDGQSGNLQQAPATPGSTTDERGVFRIPAPIGKARVVCFSPDNTFSVAGGDTEVTAAAPGKIALQAVRAVPPPSEPGFRIKPMTVPLVIAGVDPAGPAKAAGLLAGDRVVTIDGASVAGLLPGGAMMLAWNHRPGTQVVLGIERDGKPQSIKITVVAPTN